MLWLLLLIAGSWIETSTHATDIWRKTRCLSFIFMEWMKYSKFETLVDIFTRIELFFSWEWTPISVYNPYAASYNEISWRELPRFPKSLLIRTNWALLVEMVCLINNRWAQWPALNFLLIILTISCKVNLACI